MEIKQRLQELAAKIATENDHDKLTALVKEFNKLVDDEKQPQESNKLAPDSRPPAIGQRHPIATKTKNCGRELDRFRPRFLSSRLPLGSSRRPRVFQHLVGSSTIKLFSGQEDS